ncbi:Aste57867_1480 [Aphanomyces stellatus]|uniref:Aste57867_1480 protein n=1 Tax=Aphanomyces stellatus TaxID=120398 RepID=A0A485K5E0_9STRA|nr:hypothetical protein As57867_001479 [Aphanomyces stellatus]VFT78696.1 Aste57867_1480 [Aphanomyces stellatus]
MQPRPLVDAADQPWRAFKDAMMMPPAMVGLKQAHEANVAIAAFKLCAYFKQLGFHSMQLGSYKFLVQWTGHMFPTIELNAAGSVASIRPVGRLTKEEIDRVFFRSRSDDDNDDDSDDEDDDELQSC